MEEFEDKKGSVKIGENYVERQDGSGTDLDAEERLEKLHFSKIRKLRFQAEAEPPVIEVRTGQGWRKMAFDSRNTAQTVYNRLQYHLKVYRENLS